MTNLARRAWEALEPIHAAIYFMPESTAEYEQLGMERVSHYFASRSAAMGTVPAGVVEAVFYIFSPGLVKRALRDVWSVTDPGAVVAARYAAVGRGLDRALANLPPERVDELVSTALPLAEEACSVLTAAGRPLYAAHASVAVPDRPLLALWHHLTLLREHRGDGHVAALQTHQFSPIAALVTADGYSKIPVAALQRMRGWPDDVWKDGVAEVYERGWIDEEGRRTATGTYVREQMETATNEMAAAPWIHLGDDRTEELIDALEPISSAVIAAGAIPPTE